MNRTKLIAALTASVMLALPSFAFPTRCPFVDANSGLPCMGAVFPAGMSVAGDIYECSNGHRWIETN